MNLEIINTLLLAGLIVFCVVFALRCWHRLEAIARSVDTLVERTGGIIDNIVRFRRPGAPRSAAIVDNDELERYRCKLRSKGEV